MAEGSADKGAVESHLGDTRGEVVAILVAVLCDPRSEDFLSTRERARGDHLGAKRVGLELAQVCLDIRSVAVPVASQSHSQNTYSEVATSTSTFGDGIADLIGEVLLARDAGHRLLDVKLDRRHDCESCFLTGVRQKKKSRRQTEWLGCA